MRNIGRWVIVAMLCLTGAVASAESAPSALATANKLFEAFNQHDPKAMAALVSENFELYYFSDGKAELSASGRADLEAQMVDYFTSQPTVRSVVEGSVDGPRFATFRERAISIHDGVETSASSLAVYEVVDGLILRVWYYPAEASRSVPVKDE